MAKEKKDSGKSGKDVTLEEWIERVGRGSFAPPEVCREVLDLGGDATPLEIVRALHAQLHRALRAWTDDGLPRARRAIGSSFWLLKD